MSEIFISYSRIDEPFVSRLVADLERAPWDVFYDRKLKPGQNFVEVLSQELQRAKYFLIVVSPNSLASSEVLRELRTALQLEREQRTTVVPLLIEPCDQQTISRVIGPKVYADFTASYDTGFKELGTILVKPEPGTAPGPEPGPEGEPEPSDGGNKMNKHQGIVVAVITAIVALVTAYWQFVYKPVAPPDTGRSQYSGRVIDSSTQQVIRGAKVSVETEGVPQIYYSDTDGVFYLKLPSSGGSARIRVEANGYEPFDRNVSLSRTGIEEVRLAPSPVNQNSQLSNQKPGPLRRPKKAANANNTGQDNRIDRILKSSSSNKPN